MRTNVIPIWQPIGYSTHQISKNVGKVLSTRATHTGTLDPLAEGVIIVLTDEERYKKHEYTNWKKTYEFDITLGISTDSYDAMGNVTDIMCPRFCPNKVVLANTLSTYIGSYSQEVPLYSAIKYEGKRLFELGHANKPPSVMPKKSGEIYNISLLSMNTVVLSELISKTILPKVESIVGNFRQREIINTWEKILNSNASNYQLPVMRISATISRGLYIRSLSQDIAREVNLPGFVTRLVRVQNGPYKKEDVKTMEEIFGKNFDKNMFVSKFSEIL